MSSEFGFYEPNLPTPEENFTREQHGLNWLQTWRLTLLHPGQFTAYRVAFDANASTVRAYLWIFIAALVRVPWIIFFLTAMPDTLNEVARRRGMGPSAVTQIMSLLYLLFLLSVVLSVPLFKLQMHVTHWSAKQFNGSGSRNNLTYLTAAFQVPQQIIQSAVELLVLLFLSASVDDGIVSLIFGVYWLIWSGISIKAVYSLTWGQTIGTIILTFILLGVFWIVAGCALLQCFGPAISNMLDLDVISPRRSL